MRLTRWIIGTAGAAALLLGLASAGANYALASWLRGQAASGRIAAQTIAWQGWPLKIGARLTEARLGLSPGVETPDLTVAAPLWDPLAWRIRAASPLTLRNAVAVATVGADEISGRLALGYAPELPLRGLAVTMNAPVATLTSVHPGGEKTTISAQSAQIAARRAAGGAYDVTFDIPGIVLPPGAGDLFAPDSGLEDRIDALSGDLALSYATPPSLSGEPSALSGIAVRSLSLNWGGRRLAATGSVAIDPDGTPEGRIDLSTKDWQAWLDVARKAGWLGGSEKLVYALARSFAAAAPDGAITAPLTFAGGRMSIGPLPLGRAPKLR